MTAIPLYIPTQMSDVGGPLVWFLPQVSDVLGRGRHDLVFPNPDGDGTFVVYLNGDPQDQLVRVTDGMNALDPPDPGFMPTVSITYGSLVDLSITQDVSPSDPTFDKLHYVKRSNPNNTCVYPRTCVAGPERVVYSYELNDGQNEPRTFSVSYRDARYHRLGRGMLGFGERDVIDDDTGAGTAEFYDNVTWDPALEVFPFAGQVGETWAWSPALAVPTKISGLPSPPTQVELVYGKTTLQEVPTDPKTYFTLPIVMEHKRSEATFAALPGQTLHHFADTTRSDAKAVLGDVFTVVSSYDTFGNVLQQDTIVKEMPTFDDGVTRTVENDTAHWLLGEVTFEESCSEGPGGTQCRSTSRTFDGYGDVTGAVNLDPLEPQTQLTAGYFRDGFGNVKLVTAYDESGHYRSACTSYESEGIFPYARRNQLGHTALFDYDPGLGVLRGAVDPNSLATRLRHDGFGRLTEERYPDGSSATHALARDKKGGPNGDWWRLLVTSTVDGGPVSTRELDSLGRSVHAWAHVAGTQSCNGSNCASVLRLDQETTYDHFGRVTKATVPWMENDAFTNTHADTYTYDAIGRPIAHTEPWGRKTTYTYDRNKVTATDWLGSTTREVDALGRTVKVTDKKQYTVETKYGPFSQPYAVTRFGNETTTTHRDAFGQIVEEDDPDRGTTTTQYDGFGEVLTIDDAAARHFAFTYDGIGRLVERDDTVNGETSTTTWAYDTSPQGIGKIAQVTSPQGHADTYTYTHVSQPETHTLTFADTGESFSATLSYDTLGRVSTVAYPSPPGVDPLTTRRVYDGFGNVVEVRDDTTQARYWSVAQLDGAGRPTKEVLGNGVVVQHAYAPESGVVKRVEATWDGKNDHAKVQDLGYDYDLGLRMTSRADNLQKGLFGPLTETFGYDAIDRLTCVGSGLLQKTCASPIDYSPNGNIATKDGLAYAYDPAHPHAVKTVGTGSYIHDDVGNQTGRPDGTTIDYTPFDLPSLYTFAAPTGSPPVFGTSFEYDGSQHRIRKSLLNADGFPDKETAYLDELYERVRDDTGVDTHRFYIGAGSATVVLTRSAGTPDEVAYALTDALGSVDAITGDGGKVIEKRSYDAFGARRNPAGWGPWVGPLTSGVTPVGFEGLETDDEAGLVNMRGRIYDPKIGRFLSTDPIVSRPGFGQSWNPYSYVLNSPLSFTDPSGFQDAPTDPNRQPLLPSQPIPGCNESTSCRVEKSEPPHRENATTVDAITFAKDGARDDAVANACTVKDPGDTFDGPTAGPTPPPPPPSDPRYPDAKYHWAQGPASPAPVAIVSPQGVVGVVEPPPVVQAPLPLKHVWREYADPRFPGYSYTVEDPDTSKVEPFATVALAVVPGGVEMMAVRGAGTALAAEPVLADVVGSVIGDAADTAALETRAAEVHGALDAIGAKQRTTAVLDVGSARIVGGGARDLSPAQRALLHSGEIPAKLAGEHAEITVLETARKLGLAPRAIGVSRTICPNCAQAIRDSGGTLTSDTTAVWH
jgi:RHS repeat-associated protein